MVIIHQGDEYYLSFKIKKDNVDIKPTNIQDLRIQIADKLKSYLNNEITYDFTNQVWKYPLTQEETYKLQDATTKIQVGIKEVGCISYSPVQTAYVGESIIQKEW